MKTEIALPIKQQLSHFKNEEEDTSPTFPSQSNPFNDQIAIPINNGIQFVQKFEIVYLEAESNYTKIFFRHAKPILVSRTLKSFEKGLEEPVFFRTHRSYIVNLTEVKAYLRSNGGELLMSNDQVISVSKSNHESILSLFQIMSSFI